MSSSDLPDVHKAYGHIAGKGVKVERRNTEVILKYCRQFFGKTEVELSVINLAHASRLLTLLSMHAKELGQGTSGAEMVYVSLIASTRSIRAL